MKALRKVMFAVRTYQLSIAEPLEIEKLEAKFPYNKSNMLDKLKHLRLKDQSIVNSRLNECNNCEHYIKSTTTCKKCGCFMKIKAQLSNQKCPIDKWGPVYDQPTT